MNFVEVSATALLGCHAVYSR